MPPKRPPTGKKKGTRKTAQQHHAAAAAPSARGRGEYKIAGVPAGKAVGGAIGGLFGDTGRAIGSAIGSGAHWLFRKITGRGSYKMRLAQYLDKIPRSERGNSVLSSRIPSFSSGGEHVEVSFEEFVGPVIASRNFQVTPYAVNPGITTTFPWLSSMAHSFQQYELIGCMFQYRSLMSEATSATGAMGDVAFASDYNANDAAPLNLVAALNSDYSCSYKGSEHGLHPVECAPRMTAEEIKYVRSGGVDGASADLRWSDQCTTYVCTQGFPQEAVGLEIGQLWVSYRVRFLKPTMTVLGMGRSARLACAASAGTLSMAFPTNTLPAAGSTLQPRFYSGSALAMPKVPGNYMLVINAACSAAVTAGFGIQSTSTDVTGVNSMRGNAGGGQALSLGIGGLNGSAASLIYSFSYKGAIEGAAPDISFIMPTSGNITNTWWCDVFLYAREPGLAVAPRVTVGEAVAQILAQRDRERSAGAQETSQPSVLEMTVTSEGQERLRQWPYYGPIPPPPGPDRGRPALVSAAAAQGPGSPAADGSSESAASAGPQPAAGRPVAGVWERRQSVDSTDEQYDHLSREELRAALSAAARAVR